MGPEVSSPRPEAYGQEPEAYGKGPEAYGPACLLEAHDGLFQPSRPSAPGQPIAGSDGGLFPWDPHPHCSPCSPHRAGGRAGLVSRSPGTGCSGEKQERATMTEEEEEIHDCEVPFRTISIQVNEIIGRDLSEIPQTVGVDRAVDAP
ncbi:uncharacterized protein LOC125488184 isoform X2 [Rhincodon typus]|uniref:uncharacterized protein LOC125488184 isoform X2 n=1 Tax=Rhincodon typus TaxID=259920 RepID=UPI00203015B9|nr:uncharacterized protein LOC125488184 isoform X2 [Rhincodon typus]